MINKVADSVAQALQGVKDGATVLIGGFGTAGIPGELIDGLIAQGAAYLPRDAFHGLVQLHHSSGIGPSRSKLNPFN